MRAIELSDGSHAGAARRLAVELARSVNFDDTDAERAALVATELATNTIRHGGGGELLAGIFEDGDSAGLDLVVLDRGPGMNVDICVRDGYSTAGSAGSGLGAVMRLATMADIYSLPNGGTAVFARIRTGKSRRPPSEGPVSWGAVHVAKPGEEASGDGWAAAGGETPVFMVADGLGHGPLAAHAAVRAVQTFRKYADRSPSGVLQALHAGLDGTRGAAGAVARIDLRQGAAVFSGVGNIAACFISDGSVRHGVSHNGILGGVIRKVQDFVYPISPGFMLVMHSDGLSAKWSLDAYPGLSTRHPMLIAGILYRDFRRTRDDATVLVVKGQERR